MENQGKGEMSLLVIRGHASVQLIVDCLGDPKHSADVYLKPQDALKLADALQTAASEIKNSN